MSVKFRGWTRFRFTFPCSFRGCGDVLCSKSSNNIAENAIKHFKRKHPSYNVKQWCLSCLQVQRPNAKHRLDCVKEKYSSYRSRKKQTEEDDVNVCRKFKSQCLFIRIETGEHDDPPDPEGTSIMIKQDAISEFTTNDFKFKNVIVQFPDIRPEFNTGDEVYQAYLKEIYDSSDPISNFGKATRQLLSFELGKYFHVIIHHDLLKQFLELYRSSDFCKITTFFCYCHTRNCDKKTPPDHFLHVHFLVYITQLEKWRKIWKKLIYPHKKEKYEHYKTTKPIKSFLHYFNTMMYVSQKKACSNKNSHKKHFLINTPITTSEELKLMLIYPVLAANKIVNYSAIEYLQHYDIYKQGDIYYSRLDDILDQIGFYVNVRLTDAKSFDFINKVLFEINSETNAKEILLRSFGKDAYLIWKNNARRYCTTLFIRKTIKPKEETENYELTIDKDNGNIKVKSREIIIGPTENINYIVSGLKWNAKLKNVRLVGKYQDIKTFKSLLTQQEREDEEEEYIKNGKFKVIIKNTEFFIFYQCTDQ